MELEQAVAQIKVAGVAIIKNESTYLDEWILYHLSVGIDHIFIYDNFSTDNTYETLRPYISGGVVTLINWPLFRGQDDAYAHAFKTQASSFDWVACFDIDEFFLLKKHKNIKDFLSNYAAYEQIIIPWRFFGHSNHIKRPQGLVIENYTTCDEKLHTHTKYFIKPSAVIDAGVHVCTTRNKKTVNERKQLIDEHRFHSNHSAEIIQINHYYTRSHEEFAKKLQRGQADGRDLKKIETFQHYDFKNTDFSAANHSIDIKSKMQLIEKIKSIIPTNSGFLSDMFLPHDNLPIKYIIRDKIDELIKYNKNDLPKHLKYNFGSVIQCNKESSEKITAMIKGIFSELLIAPWSLEKHESQDSDHRLGCPIAVGSIEATEKSIITIQVDGQDWLGKPTCRKVIFTIPFEGYWCFGISIGRLFIKAPSIKIISSEIHSMRVTNFNTALIW